MPLKKGRSSAIIGQNISEMVASGHPHDQAVAAALHNAGVPRKKNREPSLHDHADELHPIRKRT